MHKGDMTRQRVLVQTMELIHNRGLGRTSISDIIASTGVKKGNLYFHFNSKDDLALEAIEHARCQYEAFLDNAATGDTPRERLDGLIDAVVSFHIAREVRGGCIFGNTALEAGGTSSPLACAVARIFLRWKQRLAVLIDDAARAGAVRSDIDPETLACTVIAVLEGAIMLAKINGGAEDLIRCSRAIKTMLAPAGEKASQPNETRR
jgi:TetR/AcrR family transcriptional repressor of nem operon